MEKGAPLRSKGKEDKLKGKDDSSTKPKNARKVQFNFEGSPEYKTSSLPKSFGKDDTPFPKGYSGKGGGKGDKIANGGKSTVFKEPQPLELKVEQDLPENVKCMMDCEALDILQGIQDQLPILSKDPEFRLPVPFDKGLQYAKRGVHYANPQAVRQVLEGLTKYGVSNSEICVIANVCPESDEEVFSLVPSLKAKRSKLREPLKGILSELAKLKESANLESQHKQESLHKWGDQHKGEDQHMKESQHEGEDQHTEESQHMEEDQHKGEDQHLEESQHKGEDQNMEESQHKGKDQHMEEGQNKGENQHLEESQHKGEDEHMEGQNKGEDQHLEEIQHKGEDLHMKESQHKEESAHQGSYLTSSKA
ncbi:DNA-directed RNA polymerases IV and V subunit 4-like [Quercus robur]|uniref:DNA-directed RNA polymerases IV and V subunit 4-like n=1 Tax=Quercus robur TaxID=38942 RepID=UPI002161AF25|nr:DNA-directed RNA polymerases IV and V subunit 4-like [Quercus robur]